MQALEDTKCTEAETISKNGEIAVEKSRWPANFRDYVGLELSMIINVSKIRTEQNNGLEHDQEAGDNSPEHSSRLIGNCTTSENNMMSTSTTQL